MESRIEESETVSSSNAETMQVPVRGEVVKIDGRILEHGLEEQFPSLELAYDIAIASFEQSQKRLDAVDGKHQSLTALCVASFVVLPTIARALDISFRSPYFVIAIVFIALAVFFSVVSLKGGTIDRLHPMRLFENWLDLPEGHFRKDAIYFAGESLDKAQSVIEWKWQLHTISIIFYFLSILFAAVWFATS